MEQRSIVKSILPQSYVSEFQVALDDATRHMFHREHLEIFNPDNAPISALPELAYLVGAGVLFTRILGEQFQRDIIKHAWYLNDYRGSELSLGRFADISGSSYRYEFERDANNRVFKIIFRIQLGTDVEFDQTSVAYFTRAYRSLLPLVAEYTVTVTRSILSRGVKHHTSRLSKVRYWGSGI